MSRLFRHRGAACGAAIVVLLAAVALLAPWLAPHDPDAMRLGENLRPPSWTHPFGTDSLGRDVLSQVMFGARISLVIGGVSVGLALLGGVPIGLAAGFAGGWPTRYSASSVSSGLRKRVIWML